jgi:hypothetical protein
MSVGHINHILALWAVSLLIHNDEPPFANASHVYDTIDSTPLGDVPWECFSLQHSGIQPEGDASSWMEADYDVWFRDPRHLVHNILSNPDFKDDFDFAPLQEHAGDENHRFCNFMSGNWAWNQAVSLQRHLFHLRSLLLLGHNC